MLVASDSCFARGNLRHEQHVRRGDVVTLGRRGVRIAGGDADEVALVHKALLVDEVEGLADGHVNGALGGAGKDGDAPVEAALTDGLIVRGHSKDRQLRAEVTAAKPMEPLTSRTPPRSW